MNKKFNISKEEAQVCTQKAKKEMDVFFKKHCLNTDDILTLVLKIHLYVETCLNKMILLMLPNPKTILNKRFSDKVDIVEALSNDLIVYNKAIIKMRALNKLRNSFAHKLDADLKYDDIAIFINEHDTNSDLSQIAKLKQGFSGLLGYLHFLIIFEEHFPFTSSYYRNNKIFKRDKGGYPDREVLNTIYPINELEEVLEYFRM